MSKSSPEDEKIALDFLSENKDNEDSKLFNLGFRTYFGKHWMQSLELYQEKGFFVENHSQTISVFLPCMFIFIF